MKARGYGTYHGRSGLQTFLRFVLITVIVLIILFVVAIVFLQRFIVYSADGPRLVLPFMREAEPPADEPAAPPDVSTPSQIIVEEPEPSEEPEPEPEPMRAVLLPHAALYDGTAPSRIAAHGATAAIYDMKADSGDLGYVSAIAIAADARVSSSDAAINAAIRAYIAESDYTIARVSCFKDHKLSNADRALAVTTNSGYRWTDPDGVIWVSPTSEAVTDYITQVCVELAELGFDEILLDNATYPFEGNIGYIRPGEAYDRENLHNVIAAFYAKVSDALEPYDVALSIMTEGGTPMGEENMRSGQTAIGIAAAADRVYVYGEVADFEAVIAAMGECGMNEPELNVVRVTDVIDTDAGYPAAVMVKEES